MAGGGLSTDNTQMQASIFTLLVPLGKDLLNSLNTVPASVLLQSHLTRLRLVRKWWALIGTLLFALRSWLAPSPMYLIFLSFETRWTRRNFHRRKRFISRLKEMGVPVEVGTETNTASVCPSRQNR